MRNDNIPSLQDQQDKLSTVTDTTKDNLEYVFDGLTKFILQGQVNQEMLDTLEGIPVIKNIGAVIAIYGTMRNRFVAKKIAVFIDTLQSDSELDKEKFQKIQAKFGDERILEEVINRIDRLRSEIQAEIYANLYRALIDGYLEWDRFTQIADAVETLSVTDINQEDGKSDSGPSFVAAGLAYLYYEPTRDIGRIVMAKNGEFFNLFWQYGLEPYKKKRAELAK
jgi:hypothetical protein